MLYIYVTSIIDWWRVCVIAVSFSYSDSDSQDVMMNINRTGNKKNGGIFNSTADITPNQMRCSVEIILSYFEFEVYIYLP